MACAFAGFTMRLIMYNYNVTIYPWGHDQGMVQIDTAAGFGYFEHKDGSEGGGLWFEGSTLVDYDGVFDLPRAVERALKAYGFTLEWEHE